MESVMASQTANSNVALNGRDIVIDYIKFKNPNIDEILRSQFITKKAKAATKTMRTEGKRYECIVARLGFNDLSTEAENLPYDQVTFKEQFKDAVHKHILKLPKSSLDWGKIISATVFSARCAGVAAERLQTDAILSIVTVMWEIFSDLSKNIVDMGDWSGFVSYYANVPNPSGCMCTRSDKSPVLETILSYLPVTLVSSAWILYDYILSKSSSPAE